MPKPSLVVAIREGLRARIEAGEWTDQLPSEPELATRFGASRETVRKALAALEAEGRLHRIHGKGTFVETAVSFNPLSGALSITEELGRSGLPVTSQVLDAGWMPARDLPSAFLRGAFEGAAQVYRVTRLRVVRRQAFALETSYFRDTDVPGIEEVDLQGSLHRMMTERFGLSPERVENRIQALDFRLKEAREAASRLGSRAVLRVERLLTRRRRAYYAVVFTLRTDLYPLAFTQVPARLGGHP